MGKNYTAFQYVATTGAGIAIGGTGGIDLAGVLRASDLAGTIVLEDNGTTILTMSADRNITFHSPLALTGPVTMTSSAGDSFVIMFRQRPVK